jgi:hypothetical protein
MGKCLIYLNESPPRFGLMNRLIVNLYVAQLQDIIFMFNYLLHMYYPLNLKFFPYYYLVLHYDSHRNLHHNNTLHHSQIHLLLKYKFHF